MLEYKIPYDISLQILHIGWSKGSTTECSLLKFLGLSLRYSVLEAAVILRL